MYIYAVNISKLGDITCMSDLISKVSLERQARIRRFVRSEDAVRSLIAELLVRHIIGFHRQIPHDKIFFDINPYGKPILRGDPSFHYNISHSGDWVLCAVSEASVGIDIEKIASVDPHIAERYFTEAEQRYVFAAGTTDGQWLNRFYEIWTLKESYIKAVGTGLSMPLQFFSVVKDELQKSFQLQTTTLNEKYYFRQYELDPLYKCAVCAELPISVETINPLDGEDFLNSFR
jgi:4'-phosphopantetheinyl transferase